MNKYDHEIENFKKVFSDYKDKKIVLYGTGRMTATLLNANLDYQIIGLCDRDSSLIGITKYGHRILSQNEVESQADLVIINTSETYWGVIGRRISEWKIPVFYLNGRRVEKSVDLDKIREHEYWKKSFVELSELADQYEVISFDVFDTLLMRKVLFPYDAFQILNSRLNLVDFDFPSIRKEAAAFLENPTLNEIYDRIAEIVQECHAKVEKWMNAEVELEQEICVGRNLIIELCKKVILEKKEVFIISDMYYSSEVISDLLSHHGINVPLDHIIVSCEIGKTKSKGDLWDYYSEQYLNGRNALHIGDDLNGDEQQPQKRGISVYRIMSAYEMLDNSSLRGILPYSTTLYSSLALGHLVSRLFNDPFAINASNGLVGFEDEVSAGYTLLGPLMDCFYKWLIREMIKNGESRVAFFSREGYLMLPLFNAVKQNFNANDPQAVYLEISRRAIWAASITSISELTSALDNSPKEWIVRFLQDKIKNYDENICSLSNNEIIERFGKEIVNECKAEREGYLQYLKELDLDNACFVDSQFYGTTQYYLSRVLNRRTTGYYLCMFDGESEYKKTNSMQACYVGGQWNVHKQAQFLEAFFTSPKGMLKYIDREGIREYSESMSNQTYFSIRYPMLEGIIKYIQEMASLYRKEKLDSYMSDCAWADRFLGVLMNDGFTPTYEMKKSFFFDNSFSDNREMPIWE